MLTKSASNDLKLSLGLILAAFLMGAVDIGVQHAFMEPCERAHHFQPEACYK